MSESYVIGDGPGQRMILQERWLSALYRPLIQKTNQELKQLAVRNCQICTLKHLSFIFKGEAYIYEPRIKGQKITNRLHRELYPIADKLVREFNEIQLFEKPLVANYFSSILMKTNLFDDLYALLPEFLHGETSEVPNMQMPKMTPEQIAKIKQDHQQGYELLCARAMWNLIT